MKKTLLYLTVSLLFLSCSNGYNDWKHEKKISLGTIAPIGIAPSANGFWVSDGDNNKLVEIDSTGKVTQEYEDLERPMHIASQDNTVYIPSFMTDTILSLRAGKFSTVNIPDSLDAPAAVDIKGSEMAIADFYNHRILYSDGSKWTSIGKEGNGDLEFYYPTDIHIGDQYLYIADAYNNRIQIIDKSGGHVKNIGREQKMNAATGIFVQDENIFITDFEHDRVLVFDLEGELLQEIKTELEKPTDLVIKDDKLYIVNYKSKSMSVYAQ